MWHQINISLNGKHMFRTDWYWGNDLDAARVEIAKRFPKSEGFEVDELIQDRMSKRVEVPN